MNFKENLQKVKDFGKKHWKGLLIGGAVVGGTITAIAIGKKYTPAMPIKELSDIDSDLSFVSSKEMEKIAKLDWQVGNMTALWNEGDYAETIVDNVKVSDLGKLGEEFVSKIEGITEDSVMSAVIDIGEGIKV